MMNDKNAALSDSLVKKAEEKVLRAETINKLQGYRKSRDDMAIEIRNIINELVKG